MKKKNTLEDQSTEEFNMQLVVLHAFFLNNTINNNRCVNIRIIFLSKQIQLAVSEEVKTFNLVRHQFCIIKLTLVLFMMLNYCALVMHLI